MTKDFITPESKYLTKSDKAINVVKNKLLNNLTKDIASGELRN